jgi:hypothetical protein
MQHVTKQMKLSVIGLIALTTPLASCQTLSAQGECKVFDPFYASSKDTRSTQNQASIHNEKGVAVCGWKMPVR